MSITKSIRKPIGFKVFGAILLVVFLVCVLLYAFFLEQYKVELVAGKKEAVQEIVISLQDTLQFLAGKNEMAQIQKTITSLGVGIDLSDALLFDDNGDVIASTRIEYISENIDVLMLLEVRNEAKLRTLQVKKSLKNVIWLSADGNDLYAISPIVLGRLSSESIRSDKVGALFLHYDMQLAYQKNRETLTSNFFPVMAILIFAGLVLAVYFNVTIVGRIKRLNDFTRSFSKENYNERIQITASDEISDLGQAFNEMAQEVQKNHLELLTREKNLEITLNSIGDAVITTDKKGFVTRMNPVAVNLTGWSFQEAQGLEIKKIFPIINASTREVIQNPIEKVLAMGDTVYLSNHTTLIAKDGTEYQIADSAAPIRGEDNNILGMVLIFNDVTEQYLLRETVRESEDRFRQIADNVDEVFWIGSVDWSTVFYVNPAYEKIWGQRLDDLYSNPKLWMEAIHPDDRDQVMKDLATGENNTAEYINFKNYRLQRPDGEVRWIKSRAYPIHDDDGKVIRYVGIAEDITQQINMEEDLRRSQKMDALGNLTGGIAHDYNNMLGVVMGYAELLKGQLQGQPKLLKYANQIHHAGERGAKLTKKLLSFSRYEASEADSMDLSYSLQSQQHMLEKTLTVRIKLILDLAENCWPIWVDESEMEDIILNMSINAMHAMEGAGTLTIRTSNELLDQNDANALAITPGEYVLLSIVDTGCGIDETIRENIFEPFFSTKGEHGTGLGLSQVYGFVQRSGGVIKVYSEAGNGTRFALYFPRHNESGTKEQSVEDVDKINIKGSETILIVDDEPVLLSLNSEILSEYGFNVLTSDSTKNALEILEQKSVDLLVSDIIMPEMDGFQLAAIVKDKYPDMKIQLVSGFAIDDHMDMVDESTQKNILLKPFSAQSLLQRVHALLNE